MIDEELAVHVERPDLVPAMALRGARVKETRVLVALLDRPEFPSLLPVRSRAAHRELKVFARLLPELDLPGGETPGFFLKVKKRDDKTTVVLKVGDKPVITLPNLGR
jgi:hypothetical protein